ncbi:MAG: ADP-ribosylglycohydrolase family protein [Betaproteobacteria bacterium]|nr:ADP-ribosylglycohydrolase family protein [Betaproteobacteria bacterium]
MTDEIALATPQNLPRKPGPDKASLASRYRGCLLGGAVGDALGAPVEFMTGREIRARYGKEGIRDFDRAFGRVGAITDDTQMTLFTAEGLLRGLVRFNHRGIGPAFESVTANAYLRWLRTQGGHTRNRDVECRGEDMGDGWLIGHRELHERRVPGNTCLSALEAMESLGDLAQNNSKGCGGLMRIAPVALFMHVAWSGDEAESFGYCFDLGCSLAGITHGHPSGRLPAGVLSLILLKLLKGSELPGAIRDAKEVLRDRPDSRETLEAIDGAERAAQFELSTHRGIAKLGQGWIAEEALAIALYCGLTAQTFEEGVLAAVNHDGDSDSTGAIAGNLLGLMWGVGAIPERWLKPLELHEVIQEVAEDLLMCNEWQVGEYEDSEEDRFYWNRYPGF